MSPGQRLVLLISEKGPVGDHAFRGKVDLRSVRICIKRGWMIEERDSFGAAFSITDDGRVQLATRRSEVVDVLKLVAAGEIETCLTSRSRPKLYGVGRLRDALWDAEEDGLLVVPLSNNLIPVVLTAAGHDALAA